MSNFVVNVQNSPLIDNSPSENQENDLTLQQLTSIISEYTVRKYEHFGDLKLLSDMGGIFIFLDFSRT